MKNKTLQNWLSELPDDYNIVLSEFDTFIGEDEQIFEVVLDMPINGLVKNDSDKEIRFLLDRGNEGLKFFEQFGKVRKLK